MSLRSLLLLCTSGLNQFNCSWQILITNIQYKNGFVYCAVKIKCIMIFFFFLPQVHRWWMQLSVQLVCTALTDLTSPSAVLLVTTPIARACLAATSVLMGETVWFLMPYYEFTQFSSVLGGGCKSIWNVICAPPNLCWKLSCWKSFCVCLMDSGSILPSLSRSIDHWLLLFFYASSYWMESFTLI